MHGMPAQHRRPHNPVIEKSKMRALFIFPNVATLLLTFATFAFMSGASTPPRAFGTTA